VKSLVTILLYKNREGMREEAKLGRGHTHLRQKSTQQPSQLNPQRRARVKNRKAVKNRKDKIKSKKWQQVTIEEAARSMLLADPNFYPCATSVNFSKAEESKLMFLGGGVHVTHTDAFGWTLRASHPILEGAWITQYGGHLLSSRDMSNMPETEASHVKGGLGGGQGIDGIKEPLSGLPGGSFANDSAFPNARLFSETNGVFLRATKNIKRSEPITISYHHAKGHETLEFRAALGCGLNL
jgi:hypothetical protein